MKYNFIYILLFFVFGLNAAPITTPTTQAARAAGFAYEVAAPGISAAVTSYVMFNGIQRAAEYVPFYPLVCVLGTCHLLNSFPSAISHALAAS